MNIYIYNCSNTYNYGSMMMGENFINYFNNIMDEDNVYYVETTDESNIDRLRIATNNDEIYSAKMDSLFVMNPTKYDYALSFFKLKNVTSEFLYKIDLVVVLGGDDFTEDYGWKAPIINAIKFNILQRKGLKVIMLGQTMGPYFSFRKPLMKGLLAKVSKIYPRDPITYDYLKKLGLKNINITDDLALLKLTKQEKIDNNQEYITYCPSELIYKYSKDGKRSDWIDFNLFMMEYILDKYPDKKLVLLAHVIKPEHVDDRIIVNELFELVRDKYANRIILKNSEMLPYEVRNYIQQSLFVISSRMHPVVSSIQCEVPAIALSYSSKYWGIIGERYGLRDFILDVRYLNYDEMKENFMRTIDIIELEYDQIENTMKKNNKLANINILKTLNEIYEL